MLFFLLNSRQATTEQCPNMHYECLDDADSFSLLRSLLSRPETEELFCNSVILASHVLPLCLSS
jgi:hypothetical protein